MESSQIFGATEECNSCESGWTMYIGSPIHGDDGAQHSDDVEYGDDCTDDGNYDGGAGHDDDNDDSDDSMASDASSGPSHQGHLLSSYDGKINGHGVMSQMKRGEVWFDNKKKTNKAQPGKRREKVKEEKMFVANGAHTTLSGSKVRKNMWVGKRKI